MMDSKRILIVNDDGIDSEGINLLERVARKYSDDIWVVAPDTESSGAGHSMSIAHPIRMKQIDERHFSVRGTPTDCALLGIHELTGDRKPDIILSGVNRGPNLADDLTYSGTCSAAMEGAMLGVPAIAFSQVWKYQTEVQWATSEKYAAIVLDKLLAMDWKRRQMVNVNFPHCPPEDVKGIRVTKLGSRPSGAFHPVGRIDERHIPYWWIKIAFPEGGNETGNDLQAVVDNEVSITPLHLDLTDHGAIAQLKAQF